jgi:hypothetical protein
MHVSGGTAAWNSTSRFGRLERRLLVAVLCTAAAGMRVTVGVLALALACSFWQQGVASNGDGAASYVCSRLNAVTHAR